MLGGPQSRSGHGGEEKNRAKESVNNKLGDGNVVMNFVIYHTKAFPFFHCIEVQVHSRNTPLRER
jgi:hypothetical protein